MPEKVTTCWKTDTPLHVKYPDEEWGVPLHDDNMFFEFLVLGGFQTGLTWWIILQRRNTFRQAFDNFDLRKVANYTIQDVDRLMGNRELIRNKNKILASINNARCFLKIQKELGSFDSFIWQFVKGQTITNSFTELKDLPAETLESKTMSCELRKNVNSLQIVTTETRKMNAVEEVS